ncbi:hypothetical protein CQW23_26478 [Capsicum baccatum]|uniref:Histone deacetylase complex subunit SAP30 Sin3 binding domain-containing protein n=1 Tax=Capsicum baccatum TaxID=33114 RepID=A0A2G2VNW8_CAPBA|nr:hypothetical protein CQW23_26478 [Capsicum baccatum]
MDLGTVECNSYLGASDDTRKSHRSRHCAHKSLGSSHKAMGRSLSCDSQSKGSISTHRGSMKVDLSKLEMVALWRYWRHFNLREAIPNPSKEQLITVVQRHFTSQVTNVGLPKVSDALSGEIWEIKKERTRKCSGYGKLLGWDLRSVSLTV